MHFVVFTKSKALERRFQQVYIGEPSPEDTVSILRGLKPKYEVHHGVRIRDEALLAAAKLSSRYLPDRYLPDKAIGKFTRCMFIMLCIHVPLLT
jgi:ATP-dependent Clp protease ATP-binding subunit ClpB